MGLSKQFEVVFFNSFEITKRINSKHIFLRSFQISTLLIFTLKTDGGVLPTSRNLKLSEVEWNNYNYREPTGSGTYAFGYEVEDPQSSNVQYRSEEKHPNGSVTGSYGYLMPDGNVQTVNYIADENGYR